MRENLCCTYNVDFEPWWREHVIDKIAALFTVAPIVRNFPQLVPYNVIVRIQHRVHITVQSEQVIHRVHIKLYLNEVIWIRYIAVKQKRV